MVTIIYKKINFDSKQNYTERGVTLSIALSLTEVMQILHDNGIIQITDGTGYRHIVLTHMILNIEAS